MKKTAVFLCIVILSAIVPVFSSCAGSARSTYDVSVIFNESDNSVDGHMKLNYKNDTDNVLTELCFNFYANAFRKDAKLFPATDSEKFRLVKNGLKYGGADILSVTDGKNPLEYFLGGTDKTLLTVKLSKELYPDDRTDIVMDYCIQLCNAPLRTGYNENSVNLANFYPVVCVYDNGFIECPYYAFGDPFYSRVADYSVSVTLPKEYVVASSGELKKTENKGDVVKKTYKLNNARDFCLVLSKNFNTLTRSVGGVQVVYYYYNDITPENSLSYAADALCTFSDLFGEYPYKTYSVVQTAFSEGGMEYPALVYVSDGLEEQSYGEVIVHETAHQWWYSAVGNNQIDYAFLDEGLAEYSTVLFFEKNPSYGISSQYLMDNCEQTYRTFCSVYNAVYKKVDTSMLRSLKEYTSEYEYVCIAYIKGCMLFENVKGSCGEDAFYAALKEYYSQYRFSEAAPQNLVSVFVNVAKIPEGYFNSWFNGSAVI